MPTFTVFIRRLEIERKLLGEGQTAWSHLRQRPIHLGEGRLALQPRFLKVAQFAEADKWPHASVPPALSLGPSES